MSFQLINPLGIIVPRMARAPQWPFVMRRESPQAEGLYFWVPASPLDSPNMIQGFTSRRVTLDKDSGSSALKVVMNRAGEYVLEATGTTLGYVAAFPIADWNVADPVTMTCQFVLPSDNAQSRRHMITTNTNYSAQGGNQFYLSLNCLDNSTNTAQLKMTGRELTGETTIGYGNNSFTYGVPTLAVAQQEASASNGKVKVFNAAAVTGGTRDWMREANATHIAFCVGGVTNGSLAVGGNTNHQVGEQYSDMRWYNKLLSADQLEQILHPHDRYDLWEEYGHTFYSFPSASPTSAALTASAALTETNLPGKKLRVTLTGATWIN